jgi:propionate catabolism operon transcriptional regulator
MNPISRLGASRPRIWAIGMSRLGELFQEILPGFEDQADLRLVTLGFDEAIAEIRRAAEGEVDVIVAAGSNGTYLRSRVEVPVVLVNVGGSDALQALAQARRLSDKVGMISHGDSLSDFTQFADMFGLHIPHLTYRGTDEARAAVFELRDRGVDVVVGPGLVTEIAQREGMNSVFLYSHAAVKAAIETALEIARGARIEVARRERLDAVLRHLRDGVVACDTRWRVQAINPKMAQILGVDSEAVLGMQLQEIAPSIDLLLLARTDESAPLTSGDLSTTAETVQTIDGKSYAVTRVEVVEQGVRTGFVTTFQETGALQRLDRALRSKHRPRHLVARYAIDDLIGESAEMIEVRKLARLYARTNATVLVLGETGTGKELVAQGIHAASDRRGFPLVAVNCGAFPESLLESELFGYEEGAFTGARRGGKAGLIETAHQGTLFLDEIAEMPLALQTRLLRVLQEREVMRIGAVEPTAVDVRIVAATHQPVADLAASGAFRQDLLYRLNVLPIRLPPLRERPNDVRGLATSLLAKTLARVSSLPLATNVAHTRAVELLAPYLEHLMRHPWPGNVRELENIVERIAVWDSAGASDIFPLHSFDTVLPEVRSEPTVGHDRLKQLRVDDEAALILRMLEENEGDRLEVCRKLGISRSTLWRRLKAERDRHGSKEHHRL